MSYTFLGWFWLIVGGLGIGIGSVISTFGWNWQGKKEKEKYKVWWLFVTAGLFIAGLGGVFSTWGWDNLNKKGQRDALVFAMCREVAFNAKFFLHKPLLFTEEYDGKAHYLFPTFQTSAIQQFYTSGLSQDPKLIRLCWQYIARAHHCNTCFELFNTEFTRKIEPALRIEKIDTANSTFVPLIDFKESQQVMLTLVRENYAQQFKDATKFLVEQGHDSELKVSTAGVQGTPVQDKPEDPVEKD